MTDEAFDTLGFSQPDKDGLFKATIAICYLGNAKWKQKVKLMWYRVILKKVSFGIFAIILVSKEDENFTIESKGKGLSLSRFSWYLAIVKIIQIGHLKGHISQKNHDLKIVFMQK